MGQRVVWKRSTGSILLVGILLLHVLECLLLLKSSMLLSKFTISFHFAHVLTVSRYWFFAV